MDVAMTSESLTALPSFGRVKEAFSATIDVPTVPADLAAVVRDVSTWDERARRSWASYERDSVFARSLGVGVAIGDAIRLQRAIRTRRIDEWLAAAPADDVARFEAWRDAFFARCDALAALATAGLVASGLAMPEDGVLSMAIRNPARLGALIGGRPSVFATLSVYAATIVLVAREWDFFRAFAARQLRRTGVPLSTRKARNATRRLNESAGRLLITHRHAEALLGAYNALEERGVSGADADRLVLRALEFGHRRRESRGRVSAGSSTWWCTPASIRSRPSGRRSSIARMRTRRLHARAGSRVDRPRLSGRQASDANRRQDRARRSVGGASARSRVARHRIHSRRTRANRVRSPVLEAARRVSRQHGGGRGTGSSAAAEGVPAVLHPGRGARARAVRRADGERTARPRDECRAAKRRRVRSAERLRLSVSDSRHLPNARAPGGGRSGRAALGRVVGAGDGYGGGRELRRSREGQRAADELRAYLEQKLALARSGEFTGHVIGTVARDETLSEAERVANLGVVIFAGFETTTGLLSKGLDALLRHPSNGRIFERRWCRRRRWRSTAPSFQIWNGDGWRGRPRSRSGTSTWRAGID